MTHKNYLQKVLVSDEAILHDKTRIHKIFYVGWGSVTTIKFLSTLLPFIFLGSGIAYGKACAGAIGTILMILALIFVHANNEFGVTNKRVVCITGRRTLDVFLKSISGISVSQGCLGRRCNYGTINIFGIGYNQRFYYISDPYDFKRKIEEAIDNIIHGTKS